MGRGFEESMNTQSVESGLLRDFFRSNNLCPLFLTFVLHFLQNWSGVIVIVFKTVNVFETVGSSIDKYVCTVIVGGVQLLSTAGRYLASDMFPSISTIPSVPNPGGQSGQKTSPDDIWTGDDNLNGFPGHISVF